MSDALDLERRTYFPAIHQSGSRPVSFIKYVIIHDTEGVTEKTGAEATAAYFQSAASGGSVQLVVDDDSTERCLNDTTIPWGAPPLNSSGLHIEQSGHADWTRAEWLDELDMIQRCAYKVAQWCHAYGIPRVYLDTAALLNHGASPAKPAGITQHSQVSAAWHQTTHTDCGPNYPIDVFMQWVNTYFDQITGVTPTPGGEDDMVPPDLIAKWEGIFAGIAVAQDDMDKSTTANSSSAAWGPFEKWGYGTAMLARGDPRKSK